MYAHHPTAEGTFFFEGTFLSSTHGTFTKIDHTRTMKYFNKLKRTIITQNVFP